MATPSVGTVVLVRFPFSDLSNTKLRPAIVLADAGRSDFVLCQVTSNPFADPRAVELTNERFRVGSLHRVSYARPGKLFTANAEIVEREVGHLEKEAQVEITNAVVKLLKEGV